jgi:hypothetical protein
LVSLAFQGEGSSSFVGMSTELRVSVCWAEGLTTQ